MSGNKRRRGMAEAARRSAAHFAHFNVEDAEEPTANENVHVGGTEAATLGPWSSAVELTQGRAAARSAREDKLRGQGDNAGMFADAKWEPKRKLDGASRVRHKVKRLHEIALGVLCEHVEDVASLTGVPDVFKVNLAKRVCERNKLTPEVAVLFSADSPAEVELPNCALLDEKCLKRICQEVATPMLTRLHFNYCGRGMGDSCAKVFESEGLFSTLKELSLGAAYRMSDTGLASIVRSTHSLTALNLHKCSRLTGEAVEMIVQYVPGLIHLDLSDCRGIGGEVLQDAMPKLNELKTLKLDGIPEVTDEVLVAIGSGCPLEHLSVKRCRDVTDTGIEGISRNCPQLGALCIDEDIQVTDKGILALADNCKTLKTFSMRHCTKCSEESLCILASNGTLTNLNMSNLSQIKGPILRALATHCNRTLEILDVSFCRHISEDHLGLLSDACPHLKKMTVFGCSQISKKLLDGYSNDDLNLIGVGTLKSEEKKEGEG